LKLTALLNNCRSETHYQIALVIKDEVEDLETGGINVRFVGDLSDCRFTPPLTVCSNICCTSLTEMWQVQVIQIDEAALREGLPLCNSEQADYQNWALHGFASPHLV